MFKSISFSNKQLVEQLKKQGIIQSDLVYQTMMAVDRKYFAPKGPYYDSPCSIGFGATISAPHMHAFALEYMADRLKNSEKVLDVGSGSGILCVAMALLVPKDSKIYGIQHIPQIVQQSILNIKQSHPDFLHGKIQLKVGDGREGWPDQNIKFDVIHVGAAPQKIPQKLLNQLKEGGIMVIPVGGENKLQEFLKIEKIDGIIKKTVLNSVRYVPLTNVEHQVKRKK